MSLKETKPDSEPKIHDAICMGVGSDFIDDGIDGDCDVEIWLVQNFVLA